MLAATHINTAKFLKEGHIHITCVSLRTTINFTFLLINFPFE